MARAASPWEEVRGGQFDDATGRVDGRVGVVERRRRYKDGEEEEEEDEEEEEEAKADDGAMGCPSPPAATVQSVVSPVWQSRTAQSSTTPIQWLVQLRWAARLISLTPRASRLTAQAAPEVQR